VPEGGRRQMTREVWVIGQPCRMETCGTEEPYEGKPHVRTCGGAGWATTGSTQTPDCLQRSLRSRFRQQVSASDSAEPLARLCAIGQS
jgi:hypothetical protein